MTKREKIISVIIKTAHANKNTEAGETVKIDYEQFRELSDKILELDKEPVCSCQWMFGGTKEANKKDCPIHGEKKVEKLEYVEREEGEDIDIIDEYKYNIHQCIDAINKINERINIEKKISKVKLPYSSNFDNLLVLEGKINDIIDRINND